MNKFKLYTGALMLAMFAGAVQPVCAQNNKKKAKTTKTAMILNYKAVVVDEGNNPIVGAEILTREGAVSAFTNNKGIANVQSKANGVVLVEAMGYEDVVINLASQSFPKVIKMKKIQLLSSGKYTHERPDGGTTGQVELVGAVSSITGEELASYPDFSLSNALQGRLAGLVATPTVNGLGNNSSSLYIRGLHGKDGNNPITIIDGLERNLNDVTAEEIEKIEIMKDATAKILFGPRAANGVIVVTTRRGEANKRVIQASAEMGVMMGTRRPNYLNSYDYARLYNEARNNDGYPDFYSQADLEGYKNSAGINDWRFPNVDFHDYFLQNHSMYRKAVFDMNGGSDKVRYSMIVNYLGGNGFEKVGERPDLNRLNARGNLDVKVTDYLSIIADGSVRMEMRDWSGLDGASVYSALSTTRPNEYPLTLSPEILGLQPSEDGVPYFGSSLLVPNNLYAQMEYGGFTSERYVVSQTNIGLDFTLDRFVKGLSASAFITFDNYNYIKHGQNNTYPTYALRGIVDGKPSFLQMKKESLQANQSKDADETRRTLGWRANVGYQRSFGLHDVDAMLAHNYYEKEVKGNAQDVKNSNTSLRLNYVYNKRYSIEGDLALMGSNKFYSDNKYFLAGAAGAGWIISNEDFMSDIKWINFLKLKGSYGILGYDGGTSFLTYSTAWQKGSNVTFGEQNKTASFTTDFVRLANKDLRWEKSTEWNIGLEAMFLRNRLKAEVNYFNECRDDIIGSNSSQYFSILGPFTSVYNMGAVSNQGIDVELSWNDRIGDFSYQVGANMIWSKNKLEKWNEVNYPDEDIKAVGKPTDAIFGYEALGLFGKNVALDGPVQMIGDYQEGDIAYADINGDNIIDDRDKKMIGNSYPRFSGGIDVNLNYKGWGLYMLGTTELGVNTMKSNSYYWVKGNDKYSEVVLDRYHPVNNPEGTYPRLTTTEGNNNFVNSTFWLENSNFFRLKNVELSYTFNTKRGNALKKVKLFGRATNLFVLSSEKNLDPEALNAGVTNYPVYRTITGGVTLTF